MSKSKTLFLIGGFLLVAALVTEIRLERGVEQAIAAKKHIQDSVVGEILGRDRAGSGFKTSITGEDRMPVYALGIVGSMFILGGIVTRRE